MEKYIVEGMTCAACSARVEKAVGGLAGVEACQVSLLTNSMQVQGSVSPQQVIQAVTKAGYRARLASEPAPKAGSKASQEPLLGRFVASLVLLLLLMPLSMGHMVGLSLPGFLQKDPVSQGILQMLLSLAVLFINRAFFIRGGKALWHRAPNMDTLVAMGAFFSFAYSLVLLFIMSGRMAAGDPKGAHALLHSFYFEAAAMILTLITLGKMLEARAKGKTTNALKSLMDLSPKTATLLQNGVETVVEISQVQVGDLFVVRPGQSIPVDGVLVEGQGAINEAALTGESVPVDKGPGDPVSAATINQSGFLTCRATRVGKDTTLAQIIELVSDAASSKAPIAKVADRVSAVFVPVVMLLAALTFVVWLALGQDLGYAMTRGVSVLVISCPCALGLATPVAIMVANGKGARNGILFKNAAAMEEMGRLQTVVLDKTGTVTLGEPRVTDLVCAPGVNESQLLRFAAALEQGSEHPLAKAVRLHAAEQGLSLPPVEAFQALAGHGVQAVVDSQPAVGGSLSYVQTLCPLEQEVLEKARELSDQGKTPLVFLRAGAYYGLIAVSDVIKPDSPSAVAQLKQMGLRVVMLTGDNQRTALAVNRQVGADEVIAQVLPQEKQQVVARLCQDQKVAMVGDGINDAPALTAAHVGIALGAGTDVAVEAAQVVLMKNRLTDVCAAIRLGRGTLRVIHQNLFWAFVYNLLGIPLAAGLLVGAFGWDLNPMFGAAAMSLSSFCVVTNALRLNGWRLYSKETETNRIQRKEEKKMEKVMKIEGMMCEHCQARVKKVLEALDGVESAQVSYREGTARLTLSAPCDDQVLRRAVEAQDYKVVSVE